MGRFCFSTYVFFAVLFLLGFTARAQVLNEPVLGFTQACAKGVFNNFEVTVSYSKKRYVNPSNLFILELSDAYGNFDNVNKVQKLAEVKNLKSFRFNVNFALPKNVFGENYRIRVRSTHPKRENVSKYFSAYVLPSKRPTLNLYNDVSFCEAGNSKKISVTFDNDVADPAIYKYQWYKDSKPYKVEGMSIEVTEEGFYDVEVYVKSVTGTGCNVDRSNKIKATKINATASKVYLNNKEVEVGVCVNESYTFKSNVKDKIFKYRWYKDDKLIKGLPLYSPEYSTPSSKEQLGTYRLELEGVNTCVSSSQDVSLKEKEVDFKVTIEGDSERSIVPNQVIILQSSVSKASSYYEYQWYKDDKPILNEKKSKLSISEIGSYFVKVTDASLTKECSLTVSSPTVKVEKENLAIVVPNVLTPFNADGINDLWVIPKAYANNPNVKVVIYDATGKEIFSTSNYQNNWPEEVGSVKAGMLYYFRIFEAENVKKSGTISVLE